MGSALGSAILASRSVQAIGLAAAGLEAIAVTLFLIYRLAGRPDR
ncbi:hypothetical protein SZ54_5093 [Rhizobium sp. UR51a]|nr:hypothetical protein SZ54_5093 [Rhizobium sp. UR51a]